MLPTPIRRLIDSLFGSLLAAVPDRRRRGATPPAPAPEDPWPEPPWRRDLEIAAAWLPPADAAYRVSLDPVEGKLALLLAVRGSDAAECEVAPGTPPEQVHAALDALALHLRALASVAPAGCPLCAALEEAGRRFEDALAGVAAVSAKP